MGRLRKYLHKLHKEWSERLMYDGYTYEELCKAAGGGDGQDNSSNDGWGNDDPAAVAARQARNLTNAGFGDIASFADPSKTNSQIATESIQSYTALQTAIEYDIDLKGYTSIEDTINSIASGGMLSGWTSGIQGPSPIASDYGYYDTMSTNYGYVTATSSLSLFGYSSITTQVAEGMTITEHTLSGGSWTTDSHINADGSSLGFLDELVADVFDIFVDVTPEISSAIQSSTTLIGSTLLGANNITLTANALSAAADIAYANDLMSISDRNALKAGSTVIGFASTMINTIDTLNAISAAKSYGAINSAAAIIGSTLAVVDTIDQFNQLSKVLAAYGLDTTSMYSDDATLFGLSLDGMYASDLFNSTGNLQAVYAAYAKWKGVNAVVKHMSIAAIQGDPFEFMAGGTLYNAQKAGDELYTPVASNNVKVGVDRQINITPNARAMLFQENSIYQKLEPIDTTPTVDEHTDVLGVARTTRINSLIDERNNLIELYNEKVDEFNEKVTSGSFTSQESYDSAKTTLDTSITEYQKQIDSITTELEEF